ncbi:lipid-A-disaccharide synthase N-terminal domain-containing protein [Oleiagrimonas sp. C23AA]|uniref:lipid-A-disaccharide synthase N-terminal domain-containing protein n=1 Tax=Oleiagrimonas sp. C23AA TaxID=2719047 RepID=UPI00197F4D15
MQFGNSAWITVGFLGQALFGARFFTQWICTERQKKSVVPKVFWHFSIAGSAVLLIYAIHKSDPVFMAGEALSLLLFTRNLHLAIRKK